jgi:hypothetical protein
MAGSITRTEEGESFAVYEAIAATLHDYIEAARTGDGALMRKAFLESAHVRGSYDGKPVTWNASEFAALIAKGGPAVELTARIVAIDHGGSAAMARLEAENWRGTRYTDFFVLLKTGGEWKISSKVFFAHSRA